MGSEFASTLKSADTEEWIDILFYRPIGYRWALLFRRLGIHPNTVTVFSIILGMAAGVLFYYKDIYLNIIGMLLLIWANMYDSADGQLARLTGQKTPLGRILDGFAGDLWFFTIYAAICLRLQPEWGVWIWVLGAFSGCVCHAKQCQLADYYRNIHLFFLKGEENSELDNSLQQQKVYQALDWRTACLQKLFQFFYIRYTRSQEQLTPAFQRFIREARKRFPGVIPQSLRDDFRRGSRPLMKYANILTFNVRAITLFVSLLIGQPWVYFVFEVTVMNILFFYMRFRHERLCMSLDRNISNYEK
ncbi:CDP-alcohol phosphatidyltransferase family protein [Bacteroides sp. GD17]|uniref:CDP-alcohol phosphatidyltransferase family protein n=1 Tax=Bacteroides sp. GD17 TaxID=3139826 RepID=UPI0025F52F39|nr:CDP-alcohol phosphatidyltransferase family protein [uncultured Bacteroides sp.]